MVDKDIYKLKKMKYNKNHRVQYLVIMFSFQQVTAHQARTTVLQLTPDEIEQDSYSDSDSDTDTTCTKEEELVSLRKKFSVLQKHDTHVFQQWSSMYLSYVQLQLDYNQKEIELYTALQENSELLDECISKSEENIQLTMKNHTLEHFITFLYTQLQKSTHTGTITDVQPILLSIKDFCEKNMI